MPQGIYAEMHTGKGTIVLFLEHEKAPFTVANFVGLAEGTMPNKAKPAGVPFYDGTIFHRVIPEFMIQGGDPDGMGRGGPGYRFQDEFDSSLTHDGPGILSMANAGPNTNGSQFFITLAAAHARDGINAVFGHVVEGQNVVDAIEAGDRIETIEIVRHGASVADYDSAKTGFVKSDLFLFD